MKGLTRHARQARASGGATDHADRVKSDPEGATTTRKVDKAVMRPKALSPVGGKKAIARLDKPVRGKLDADAFKGGGGIKIKSSHKGLLHKELGVPKGEKIPADKLKKAAHSKDPKERKRAVFAENAKHWKH